MNYSECIIKAKDRIGKFCKACPECNGRACKNQMPGPGSKGIGDTAVRNYDKWKEIRLQMDTIAENKPVDTSLELFGKTFRYPVFAGPVGAVSLHYAPDWTPKEKFWAVMGVLKATLAIAGVYLVGLGALPRKSTIEG